MASCKLESVVYRGVSTMTKGLLNSAARSFILIALFGLGSVFLAQTANAQGAPAFNDVSNQTQTPIPGAGHDYQHLLGETVNFSNGSVSFKISFPVAPSRGITLPYAWSYNSSGVNPLNFIDGNKPAWDYSVFQTGPTIDGWNTWEGIPWTSLAVWSFAPPNNRYQTFAACNYQSGMTFTDSSGVMHNLNTAAQATAASGPGYVQVCGTQSYVPPNGDGQVTSIPDPDTAVTYLAGTAPQSGSFVVMDKSGTVYSFGNGVVPQNGTATLYSVLIEDKNGNKIALPGSGGSLYTDTAGRPGPTVTSNGIQIGNLNYMSTWGTTSVNYTVALGAASSGSNGCVGTIPASVTGTRKVLNSLGLPNGQQFQFLYNNPYGLISEIIYPDGGWVKYVWQVPPSGTNEIAFWSSMQQNQAPDGTFYYTPVSFGCGQTYQTPVLQTRTVSFDGTTVAQTQNFTYTTNWTTVNGAISGWSQKTTTVSTTDQKVGPSATTKYTYAPYLVPRQPYASGIAGPALPLEREIDYYDWGQSTPAKIVTKTWADQFDMASETTTIVATGQVAGAIYTYGAAPNESSTADSFLYLLEQDDYDYGTGPLPVPATTNPPFAGTTSSRTPAKKTIYNYTCCELFPTSGFSFSTYTGPKALAPMAVPPQLASVYVENGAGAFQAVTKYAYDGSAVASVSATQHDSTYGTGMNSRGNLTSVTRCTSPSANCTAGPTINYTYDLTGQPVSITDPKGNTTTYSFADSFTDSPPSQPTNGYLTKITYTTVNGVTPKKNFKYSYALGYLTSSIDENSNPTNYSYADVLNRLTQVYFPPTGATTTYAYNDSGASVTTSKLLTTSGLWETNVSYRDGMFHTVRNQLTTDPDSSDGKTTIDTTYDGEGRVSTRTNPYRSSSSTTDGTTTFHYDALGRLVETAEQDGSLVQMCYDGVLSTPAASYCSSGPLGSVTSGTRVDTTDEAGSHWQRVSDVFGRLIEVMEPNGSSQTPSMETDYTYDTLNDLMRVDQWGGAHGATGERVRTFTYDLSRLLTATNPETGTVTYAYLYSGSYCAGDVSLPCSKTDANNVTTTYTYDALNRLSTELAPGIGYHYLYDAVGGFPNQNSIGRLVYASNNVNADEIFSYDPMGRLNWQSSWTPSSPNHTGIITQVTYDLAGNLTQLTYPDGRVVQQTRGTAENLTAVNYASWNGQSVNYNYLSTATYWPDRAPMTAADGNGITSSWSRNRRLQPTETILKNGSGTKIFDRQYCYGPTAPISGANCVLQNVADNGNVFQILDILNGNNSQAFTYDYLNRISAFANGGSNMQQTYSIDPWGNTIQYGTLSSGLAFAGATTNRDTSGTLAYDNAGNVVGYNNGVGTNSYIYDAEGQMTTINNGAASYTYDAAGQRVRKDSGGSWTEYVYFNGQPLAEKNSNGSWTDYIFVNGVRLAKAGSLNATNPSATTTYYHGDQLGSTRLMTDGGGNQVSSYEFYPFGQGPWPDQNHYFFTGKERDSESGNDYFGARYYSSSMGRFLSPDWSVKEEPVPYAHLDNPQTLNLYAYVQNNPLSKSDPDGHCGQQGAGQQSGPSDCSQVQVTATPEKQRAAVHTTTVTDKDGNKHTVTGPSAKILMTVKVNGQATDGVHVNETNKDTKTVDGQTTPGATYDTTTQSQNGGHYVDTVGTGLSSDKASPEDATKAYNTHTLTMVDEQTQTLTFQNGCNCTATSTRTLTNVGPDGNAAGYTLTTTQPVVSTPQPPQ